MANDICPTYIIKTHGIPFTITPLPKNEGFDGKHVDCNKWVQLSRDQSTTKNDPHAMTGVQIAVRLYRFFDEQQKAHPSTPPLYEVSLRDPRKPDAPEVDGTVYVRSSRFTDRQLVHQMEAALADMERQAAARKRSPVSAANAASTRATTPVSGGPRK